MLFATGFFLYGRMGLSLLFAVIAAAALYAIKKMWPKLSFE
jgi:hypothetical protein